MNLKLKDDYNTMSKLIEVENMTQNVRALAHIVSKLHDKLVGITPTARLSVGDRLVLKKLCDTSSDIAALANVSQVGSNDDSDSYCDACNNTGRSYWSDDVYGPCMDCNRGENEEVCVDE
jgi:hypothetical protein